MDNILNWGPFDRDPFLRPFEGYRKQLVPPSLRPSLLAAYSGRYLGDYSVPMTNAVTNGDFSNGTTGWGTLGGVLTASQNTGIVTGDGTSSAPAIAQTTGIVGTSGKSILIKGKARVRAAGAAYLYISFRDSTGAVTAAANVSIQVNPSADVWYPFAFKVTLTTGVDFVRVIIREDWGLAATANGKVMEVQEVMCIDLSTPFGLSNEPAATEFSDMLTYAGTTFWSGTRQVVINPIVSGQRRYYWPDVAGQNLRAMTNMLGDLGNFEGADLTGWTSGGATLSAEQFKTGSKSIKIVSAGSGASVYKDIAITNGDKVYAFAYGYLSAYTAGSLGVYLFDTGTYSNAFAGIVTPSLLNYWQFVSALKTVSNGGVRAFVGSSSTPTLTGYMDAVHVLNLTTIFGAGNEPSQSQMDGIMQQHLSKYGYFNVADVDLHIPRHLHLVNLAYDSTGGQVTTPPQNYLFDGVNDYAVYNSATDIVAANGAVSAFVVFQAKDAVAATHRILYLTDGGTTNITHAMYLTPTEHKTFTLGSSVTVAEASAPNAWESFYSEFDSTSKKVSASVNAKTKTVASSASGDTTFTRRILIATGQALNTPSNTRGAEVYLFNRKLTQLEIAQLQNNISAKYALQKVDGLAQYQVAYIKSQRLVCNDSSGAVTAKYTGVDMGTGKVPTKMKCTAIFDKNPAGDATIALISNPNGLTSISNITQNSVHVIFKPTRIVIQLWISGVLNTISGIDLSPACLRDGVTPYDFEWTVSGNTITITGNGQTLEATHESVSSCIGRYCTLEHYYTNPGNSVSKPNFTYFEIVGTDYLLQDTFGRKDGDIGVADTGQQYVQISN